MQDVQMEWTHLDRLVDVRPDHPFEFFRWLQIV